MPTKLFERQSDIGAPSLSGDKKVLPAPPTVQPGRFRTVVSVILPVGLVVGIIGTIVMLFLVGARTFTGVGLIFPLMMMMSFGGMMVNKFGGANKKSRSDQEGEREDYGQTLDEFRNAVDTVGERQFERVAFFNPNPLDLVRIVADGAARMWCHRPPSYQFGKCRVGLGLSQSAMELKTPKLPDRTKRDPMPNTMLRDFFLEKPYIRDIPMPLALRSNPGFAFYGDVPTIRGLVRSMLCQLATFHGPDDIGIVVVTANPSQWEWLKWMPHGCDSTRQDGAGPIRMVFTSAKDFDRVFDLNDTRGGPFVAVKEPEGGQHAEPKVTDLRHLIVVDDDTGATEEWKRVTRGRNGVEATTFLRLATRPSDGCGWTPETTFQVTNDRRICDIAAGEPFFYAKADYMSIEDADEFARAMATWDVTKGASSVLEVMQQEGGLLEELRIDDARHLEPHRIHAARKSPDSKLRGMFPLGRYKDGSTFMMNVNSTSAIPRGMGNHGLLLGATGSGKSWTLLTFILSQALTHSAEVLQHIVLDWKGRSFGRRVADLPGTLMVLSNLGKDSEYVERLDDVLGGELDRRQEILDRVAEELGRPELAEVEDYERARIDEGHEDWEPLPWLQLVVDEFTELFEMYPSIVPLFVRIARLGRSLRVNLLLASQRLEESKLRGMEAHFGWRIALRAFSDAESRSFIGDVRAAKIPEDGGGGRGFIKIGEGEPQEIQVYDVGSLYRPARAEVQAEEVQQTENYFEPQLFSLDSVPLPELKMPAIVPATTTEPEIDEEDEVDVAIGALVDVAVAALKPHRPKKRHEMWLDDLRTPRLLEDLHQQHYASPWYQGYSERRDPSMTVPVGIVDKPRLHAQDVLAYDLSSVNIGIVGEPNSGRTTTAMTFLTSLAMRYTPHQVQFIGIRLGGPGLSTLDKLPHSAGIYGADDPEGLTRAVSEIVNLVESRERSFPEYGIEDVKEWRRRRFGQSNGPVPPDGFGEVWLGVDNWQDFALNFERSYEAIKSIMGKCGSYGVHVLWTSSALIGGGMQKSVTDNTKLILELRIADDSMSDVSRQEAKKVPDDIPGRGLTREGKKILHMMYGFPGRRRTAAGDLEVSALAEQIVAVAGSEKPVSVRRLPQKVSLEQVWQMPATAEDHKDCIRFGITDTDLGPARLDFRKTSSFLAVGASESGRSSLVRCIARGIMRQYTPDEAIIHMVDIKRNQLGVVTEESGFLGHYCFLQDHVRALAHDIATELAGRQPEGESDQQMLMAGAQFTGKRIFVLIDDFNALSNQGMALDPLADFVELAGFVGLHLIIAGGTREFFRWGGTGDLMRKVMGTQTPGLILNASRQDGPLVGDILGEPQREGRGLYVQQGGKVSATMVAWDEPPTAAG